MHDEPRPTDEEKEQTPERLAEEEEMRGPLPSEAETPGDEDE